MEQIVRFFRIHGTGQSDGPALVLGEILDPTYDGSEGQHALNVLVLDQENLHHAGAAEWSKALLRFTAVKHFSHPDVQAQRDSQFWLELGQPLVLDVPAAAKRIFDVLAAAEEVPSGKTFEDVPPGFSEMLHKMAAAALQVEWNPPAAEIGTPEGTTVTGEQNAGSSAQTSASTAASPSPSSAPTNSGTAPSTSGPSSSETSASPTADSASAATNQQ